MSARALRRKLRGYGLSTEVIDLAWPTWWSEEADASPSARAELRFTLARKLGLDAKVLLEEDEPRFVWRVGSFKNLGASASELQRAAIISYATSVARVLIAATPPGPEAKLGAMELRLRLLRQAPFVGLQNLLSLAWALGVPVVHLEVFPFPAKQMCAMAVRVENRHAIFLARESRFPSQVAYYLAHELGHIALGHLSAVPALIDAQDPLSHRDTLDPEEVAADQYALTALTGMPEPEVFTEAQRYSGAGLANAVMNSAASLGIEAGTLALCFGHRTGRWDKVFAALNRVYPGAQPLAPLINKYAISQVAGGNLSDDNQMYLASALGLNNE